MEKNNSVKGNLFAAAGAAGWGVSGVCSQYLFSEYQMESDWLTAVRMILSGVILLALVLPREKQRLFGVMKNRTDLLWLLAFAILGLLYCQYSFLAAIAHSNSGTATILQSLNVVMMAAVMAVWNRTGIGLRQTAAIVLAILGTYLVATHGNPAEMMVSPAGLAWGLSAAVGVVFYTLLSRPIVRKWGNLVITGWGMLIGGIVLGIFVGVWEIPENIDLFGAFMIAIIVLIGTAAGFSLFLQGIRYIGPVKATLIGCLEPATATVLSAVFLGTRFGVMEMIGFGAILGTVFLSMDRPETGKEEKSREMEEKTYIAIDLKSFYASVECMDRGLDPMTAHLVVADASRTEKTICLAVSPSLRAWGIPGRPRLFEVVQKVREINALRRRNAGGCFSGSSYDAGKLSEDPSLALDYVVAPPRMAVYMERSRQVYEIYLKYIAPEDMHVYSIDEVFIDATGYLKTYGLSARELARKIILDVLENTGITATAGIGPNLYLCKTAMDIGAKHIPADENGVRIAWLDEMTYRRRLWNHRPLTDFWRVGQGYAGKLAEHGIYTMGDIARCSLGKETDYYNEDLLYRLFGVNAELLIDHAWGWEPCTIRDIKAYKPESSSIGSGQVLACPYSAKQARLVVREMADQLALALVDKGLASDQLVLTIGYDIENLKDPDRRKQYAGEIKKDRYGRQIPKHAHGTINLKAPTSSAKEFTAAAMELFDRIMNRDLLVRRLNLTANRTVEEMSVPEKEAYEQLDLFTDYEALEKKRQEEKADREKERKLQEAMLTIKKKYGKNAILKGMNLEEGATAMERNKQIGGHKA